MGGSSGQSQDVLALKEPEDAGFLVDQVARRLEENDYRVVRPETEDDFAARSRRLIIPEAFTQSVIQGRQVTLELSRSEAGLGQDYDSIRVGRAVYTVLADVVASHELDREPSPETFRLIDDMPRALSLEVQSAGKRQAIPTGFEQAIPGIMVMFTLIVLLATGAVLLVIERKQGLLRRLASTPIPRGSIVMGKWGGRMIIGMIQISFAMIAGTIIFKMQWGPDLPMILLVLLGWGGLCASLGLLLGNLARTEAQAVGVGVIASNVLAALGGCWWPIEITPAWMQTFSKFLPTGWAMDALHKLISFQAGAASALPHVLVISAAALLIGCVGARRFQFQ
jgi:ABC-type transport system involved in multi-copper enzyme maturation permease subunit